MRFCCPLLLCTLTNGLLCNFPPGDRPRHEIQRDIKLKERARETLSRRYRSNRLSEEDILTCIYSLSDNNSYLLFNRELPQQTHLYAALPVAVQPTPGMRLCNFAAPQTLPRPSVRAPLRLLSTSLHFSAPMFATPVSMLCFSS